MSKNTIAKGYYAVFECSSEAVEVEFPGLSGCFTCAQNMEEAYDLAMDALAGWLETAEAQFIPDTPMTFEEVKEQCPGMTIMKIPVDVSIMKRYELKQRFNASFPKSVLDKVDAYAQAKGWNRSQFLVRASEKMIAEQSV
jgi:predicted RNase H-like HicB family nuclease